MTRSRGKLLVISLISLIIISCSLVSSENNIKITKREEKTDSEPLSTSIDRNQDSAKDESPTPINEGYKTEESKSTSPVFTLGLNICYEGPNPPSGWKTYSCAFWVESTKDSKLSDLLISEGEGKGDSRANKLQAHNSNDIGIYMTTDTHVNYPVDIFIATQSLGYLMEINLNTDDLSIQKGIPILGKYRESNLSSGREFVSFVFLFTIPDSMKPNQIVLPANKINVEIPKMNSYINIPEIRRDISSKLPPTIESEKVVSINLDEPSLSLGPDWSGESSFLQLNINATIASLDKTSQQSGKLNNFNFTVYDPRGFSWKQDKNIEWNLAPGQSSFSSETYITPNYTLPDVLYLIPTSDMSNIAYRLDTKSMKILNCVPATTERMNNSDNDMYPIFRDNKFNIISDLSGPGEYDIDFTDRSQNLWTLSLPARQSVSLQLTGKSEMPGYTDKNFYSSVVIYLPDGTKLPFGQNESSGTKFIGFFSLCEKYYIEMQNPTVIDFKQHIKINTQIGNQQ
jgi:hypothetical protein